jgi:hypothetical protein
LFVVGGSVTLEDSTVGAGGFIAIPNGSENVELSSETGAEVFAFCTPQLPAEYYDGKVLVTHIRREPWVPSPGTDYRVLAKSLRVPDYTKQGMHGGPGGMIRLTLLTPGESSPEQEYHHDCWEEIIFLAGDLMMAGRGHCGPGTVVSNPDDHDHGPYGSQKGALLLVHSNAPMPMQYRHLPGGTQVVDHYIETTNLFDSPRTEPWDACPEADLLRRFAAEEVASSAATV